MNKSFGLLILAMILICNQHVQAQDLVIAKKDSLTYFLEQKDLDSYFRMISALSESAFDHSDNPSLFLLSKMLQQDFGGLNSLQRKILRRAAAFLGQSIFKLTGNIDESLKIYLIAYENVNNKITLDSIAWYVEGRIMTLYTRIGDFEKSEYFGNLLENSLKHFEMNELLSSCYTKIGSNLQTQLRLEEAIDVFKKGYKLADSIKFTNGIFANAINLSALYNEHPNLGTAQSFLEKADELLPLLTADKKYLEYKATLEIEKANYNCIIKKYSESIPLYNEAIQTLKEYYPNTGRREFAKYYNSLATAYYHSDSLISARKTIDLGLSALIPEINGLVDVPDISEVYPENSFIDLLALKAKVYEQFYIQSSDTSFLEFAIRNIDLALNVNDMIRETVIADPSKLATIRSNKDLMANEIADLYKLYTLNHGTGYFQRARIMFNRSKSVLYNDKTRRNKIAELLTIPDKDKWADLQDTLHQLYDQKFEKGVDINQISGRILLCQEAINKIFNSYTRNELTTWVPENYIEYFMSSEEIYALSVIHGEEKFTMIGPIAEFENLLQRLNEYIHLKGLSLDNDLLTEMFHFFISPISDALPASIVIIPDGAIGYVPFEMLQDDKGLYLLEKNTISYSFEYINYKDDVSKIPETVNIFCLAPKYKLKEINGAEVSRGSVYDLPYAKMEVDSIQKLYGREAKVSQSSDKMELELMLRKTQIFHYAGHAIISADKAFLVLTDSGNEKEQLTTNEIGLTHHALDLVVLSACETGIGKLEKGEGIRSLGRSFMESGAKSTIISLWNVNDQSTARIMTGFYKHLREGMRKDDALRQSKLDYINKTNLRGKHPYFWAPFIPAGDMNAISN